MINIIPTKVLDINIINNIPKLIQNRIKPIQRIMDISTRFLLYDIIIKWNVDNFCYYTEEFSSGNANSLAELSSISSSFGEVNLSTISGTISNILVRES